MHARPQLTWWQWLGGCVLEALLLDVLRRRVMHESRYTRWP